ncbi:MAG: hypothetical protein QG604_877 [Candidatus Dependentiae bacterium]|nr:hypothetical protein [Candidatus Dependentiae bacterium]
MVRFSGLVVVCGLACSSLGASDHAESGGHGSSAFSRLALELQRIEAELARTNVTDPRHAELQQQLIRLTVWAPSRSAEVRFPSKL